MPAARADERSTTDAGSPGRDPLRSIASSRWCFAAAGVDVTICLLLVTVAPAVTVVGYETIGHRHMAEALERS